MAHILCSILYPTEDNHHQQHRVPKGFVAGSILRGFYLNQAPDGHTSVAPETTATHETSVAARFIPGPQRAASGNAANAAEENGDEISSQPLVPYVGMVFDDLEVVKEVYNEYAFKLGFEIHIGNTKYSQARGATKDDVLSRLFECVHAEKPANAAKSSVSIPDGSVEPDMSSFSAQKSKSKQAAVLMDVKDTRQRNKQYKLCQNLMLGREDNSGFTMETTTAALWGSWSIEEQGVKFYTREVFDRLQKILQRSTGFYPLRAEVEEPCFDLVPNPGLDLKTYRVQVGFEDETYTCVCNQFEMCGLICPHIVRVMVHMNVHRIPDQYMMHRWSIAATTPTPDPKTSGVKFGIPGINTLKYNSLCRKINSLAADACIADDTYAVVTDMVVEAKKVVAAMHRARNATHQEEQEENAPDPLPPHDLHQQ
ncbi:hypothetical protein ACQ4PT_064932 [Festuca glaucescens]